MRSFASLKVFARLSSTRLSRSAPAALGIVAGTCSLAEYNSQKTAGCEDFPWVSPCRNPDITEILIVRHGESENNAIMRENNAKHKKLGSDDKTRDMEFLITKVDDPGLTNSGLHQAEIFAATYAEDLKRRGCIVYSSAMLRALETAQPIVDRVQTNMVVRPDTHEAGGVYIITPEGKHGNGKCMSAAEIAAKFPGSDVAALPASGQWWTAGWETDAQARARLKKVVAWLRSDALRRQLDGRVMVLVCHGHFVDLLMKTLVDKPDDPSGDLSFKNNCPNRPFVFAAGNVSATHVSIMPSGKVALQSFNDTSHLRLHNVKSTS